MRSVSSPRIVSAISGAAVTAWDVVFNREVTNGEARYVSDVAGVADALVADEADPVASKERGEVLRSVVVL